MFTRPDGFPRNVPFGDSRIRNATYYNLSQRVKLIMTVHRTTEDLRSLRLYGFRHEIGIAFLSKR